MSSGTRFRYGLALAVVAVAATAAGVFEWKRRAGPPARVDSLPAPGSKTYTEMVSAFFAGVAALDVDANDRARAKLDRATELVPGEPAAWADRGLLRIRLQDYEGAASDLENARALAPGRAEIERLFGLLEGRRGRFAEAIVHLRRAVEIDPADLKARYALAREVERQGGPGSEAEALRLTGELLDRQPENLVVLLERARLATKLGDTKGLNDTVDRLGRLAPAWPDRARGQLDVLRKAAGSDPRLAATRVAFLRNVLARSPAFRQGFDAVEAPFGIVGEPISRFLRLTAPPPTPAPPDVSITYSPEPLADAGDAHWDSLAAVSLSGDGPPAVFVAGSREVRRADSHGDSLPFPGNPSTPPSPHGILAVDLNSDSMEDLVLAGAGGLRLFQQNVNDTFAEVTAATALGSDVLNQSAFGAWAADVEMDGDLDVVIAARGGGVSVLRNHGDGTFAVVQPFAGVADARQFAWADLDQDGDPDAAFVDARGVLRVFANERAGRFRPWPGPEGLGAITALTVADVDSDGAMDLLGQRDDGSLVRVSDRGGGRGWGVVNVATWPKGAEKLGRLFAADMDNNGGIDLIASGSSDGWIALGGEKGKLRTLAGLTGLRVFAVADLNGDGRLDLAGLSPEGRPFRWLGRGVKTYHRQVIRPRAARAFGDGRINSFGVGGEVEVRAGLLVQKQVITGPSVHFGLGDSETADVARIVWPNGTNQAEFDLKADQDIVATQRLKGSCPYLFAFDGTRMRFVTDFIWRSPLGLRINAQDTAGVAQTEDWVKIRGDQLAARDGHYDLSVTAELWETHYFDKMALTVVDHPPGTEVFVDERFARQPPALRVHVTGALRPLGSARDDSGRDVSDVVRARDGVYLDTFGRGPYQGVTRDHWVEAELSEDTPREGPLRLVAQGWIHPTDSSINVAIGQGRRSPPQGLVLEVATPGGGWTVARPDLGFPAGKSKTILVDLEGVFRPGAPRRFRLRTNLEIFWDSLAVAVAAPETPVTTRRLAPEMADLRPRGYSLTSQADAGSPEIPDYGTITGTAQRWRDLVGYYTRFGDVRELLERVDDRYVIANAGDEVALRFAAPPPPPAGWVRDFVMIGDGWNKDGDYNTAFSGTVLPLPSHERPGYDTPPAALEDDPVYRFHPGDWQRYHTRYVTPADFQDRLRPRGVESNR